MKELAKAMAVAFPMIEKAAKNRVNPHFRSAYADLGSVISAIKPGLTANGLWFTQNVHILPLDLLLLRLSLSILPERACPVD